MGNAEKSKERVNRSNLGAYPQHSLSVNKPPGNWLRCCGTSWPDATLAHNAAGPAGADSGPHVQVPANTKPRWVCNDADSFRA